MAITVTELTSNGSTTNTTNYATAAINPTANTLVLLAVHTTRGSSTDPVVPTVATAGGLTWVEVGNILTQDSGTLRGRFTLFRSMASSPSSSAVTIQHSATMTGCMWLITQWDGVDTSGTNGSGAVSQQAAVFNRVDGSTTLTCTLGSALTAGNAVYSASGGLITGTWAAEGGWTELPATEITIATPDAKLGGAYRLDAVDNSHTCTMSTTDIGGVIIEIKAAAAATGSLIWQPAPSSNYLR